jgi:hypothetical protein
MKRLFWKREVREYRVSGRATQQAFPYHVILTANSPTWKTGKTGKTGNGWLPCQSCTVLHGGFACFLSLNPNFQTGWSFG